LNRRKGLFEIPFIWKEIVKEYPEMKLKIFGRGEEKSIQKFERIAKKLGIIDSIEVVGYVTREELLSSISKARLFIYPSHEDCYPLAMLETLFVGTPIVAYGITPIRYIYESIKAVELVPEGDIKKMARMAIHILKNEKYYQDALKEKSLLKFLEDHSSWDNVATAEANKLKELFEKTKI